MTKFKITKFEIDCDKKQKHHFEPCHFKPFPQKNFIFRTLHPILNLLDTSLTQSINQISVKLSAVNQNRRITLCLFRCTFLINIFGKTTGENL